MIKQMKKLEYLILLSPEIRKNLIVSINFPVSAERPVPSWHARSKWSRPGCSRRTPDSAECLRPDDPPTRPSPPSPPIRSRRPSPSDVSSFLQKLPPKDLSRPPCRLAENRVSCSAKIRWVTGGLAGGPGSKAARKFTTRSTRRCASPRGSTAPPRRASLRTNSNLRISMSSSVSGKFWKRLK